MRGEVLAVEFADDLEHIPCKNAAEDSTITKKLAMLKPFVNTKAGDV